MISSRFILLTSALFVSSFALAQDDVPVDEAPNLPELPVDPLIGFAAPLGITPVGEDAQSAMNNLNTGAVPSDEKFFTQASEQLRTVLHDAKAGLVCIRMNGGSGSGVIVDKSGLILTAAHVVGEPGSELDIILPDGTELKGETLGVDTRTDAGMARILDEGGYPTVPLGDYDALKPGDWAFALGHSGGWDEDRGAVVRLGRIVRKQETTVQSDCVLIGGDSGGPLFDMAGRLIGINSRVGMNIEFSMHVPVSEFLLHDDEFRLGTVMSDDGASPFFGAAVEAAGAEGDAPSGLRLTKLSDKGSAKRSGLVVGDIVTHADGVELTDKASLKAALDRRAAGERMRINYYRAATDDDEEINEEIWIRLAGRK